MGDHVVDTNVPLVASASEVNSPFDDSHLPVEQQRMVFDWLVAFRADPNRRLVFDWRIWNEYLNRLTEQDFGHAVLTEKLQTARYHEVTYDADGFAELPQDLEAAVSDNNDRKFVAVALADNGNSSIVNSTDTDWYDAERALSASGIVVEQILDPWLRGQYDRRRS